MQPKSSHNIFYNSINTDEIIVIKKKEMHTFALF